MIWSVFLIVLFQSLYQVSPLISSVCFSIVAFWAIVFSPNLCVLGALEHACEAKLEDVCHNSGDDDSCQPVETPCHHEESCVADPCEDSVLPSK